MSSQSAGSQGQTPVTPHTLSPSLLLQRFSGQSAELRCISAQTGASGSSGNVPDQPSLIRKRSMATPLTRGCVINTERLEDHDVIFLLSGGSK
ncbi:unnamed protein product [Pleuronectes platessa]|uniref:Uncharacterized protein n=1 Tax=Pleuronectes platessa TaxID=8262 RepID=A0A9N7YI81_PLEPL|nr:unnamed protein product [Pleuronectes platessa]